jgi:hypothetical protein
VYLKIYVFRSIKYIYGETEKSKNQRLKVGGKREMTNGAFKRGEDPLPILPPLRQRRGGLRG